MSSMKYVSKVERIIVLVALNFQPLLEACQPNNSDSTSLIFFGSDLFTVWDILL